VAAAVAPRLAAAVKRPARVSRWVNARGKISLGRIQLLCRRHVRGRAGRGPSHLGKMWDAGQVAAALSYMFSVPDESHARELASALAEFGFPQVSGDPSRYGVWEVRVIDDGRQYDELHADRQRKAVRRQAMAIAWQHRGDGSGLPESYPPGKTPSLAQSGAQILLLNPGRHRPVPAVQSVLAPPPGLLSLEPDLPAVTAPDFTELWSIPWDELDHGPMWAESLPELISDLVLGQREWYEFFEELMPAITQEGTLHAASGPALTVLGRLAAAGSLEAARRRQRGQRPAARPRSPRKTPHIPASRSTAGDLGRRNPGVQPQRDGGVPRSWGNGRPAVPDRLPAGIRPQATAASCRWVRRPMRRASDWGIFSMNALIEIRGSRNGMRAPGGRPSMVPASRSGGHLKETRCATASIQRG
jgi:hypothetical protein